MRKRAEVQVPSSAPVTLREYLASAGIPSIDAWARHAGLSESLVRKARAGSIKLSPHAAAKLAAPVGVPASVVHHLLRLPWAASGEP
jgi:hypothetical protein